VLASDSKERFSNRVEDYLRYRPGYPPAILSVLNAECGLTPEAVVADIGSGTGLLAHMFLENGNLVYAVEPNAAMRGAGEHLLEKYPHFCSVAGSAESTTLPPASVDFVLVGQAFHWFEPGAARAEFLRVLKAQGWVVVLFNERISEETPFQREYEMLLRRFGTDYEKVSATYPRSEQIKRFFQPCAFETKIFANGQALDFQGLRGRLLSSSYAPAEGHRNHQPMLVELMRLFSAHQKDGRVRFDYRTYMYYGQLYENSAKAQV
jgi:SAM-dependent methyltransferase